jgi:hypothetical protein
MKAGARVAVETESVGLIAQRVAAAVQTLPLDLRHVTQPRRYHPDISEALGAIATQTQARLSRQVPAPVSG